MTLIEAVLFISVALGLIVGGIVFYQQASSSSRAVKTAQLLSAIAAEVRAINRKSQGTPLGASLSNVLVRAGSLPSEAVIDPPDSNGCQIKSPWGGCIQLQHYSPDVFTMNVWGMPSEVCARIIQWDSQGSGPIGSGFSYVAIDRDTNGPASGGTVTNVAEWDLSLGALTPGTAGTCRTASCAPTFCGNIGFQGPDDQYGVFLYFLYR